MRQLLDRVMPQPCGQPLRIEGVCPHRDRPGSPADHTLDPGPDDPKVPARRVEHDDLVDADALGRGLRVQGRDPARGAAHAVERVGDHDDTPCCGATCPELQPPPKTAPLGPLSAQIVMSVPRGLVPGPSAEWILHSVAP